MEQLVRSGKTRAIGVSNFTIPQLEKLLSFADVKPVCNQVEAHPWFPQTELLEYCKGKGIVLVAYSPLGTQPGGWHTRNAILLDDEDVMDVAKLNKVEPAQVLIAWACRWRSRVECILLIQMLTRCPCSAERYHPHTKVLNP
jgi:diketogulonate reductase-like aldo/keto reductase